MVVGRLFIAAAALFAASGVQLVQAQATSNATCEAQYQWMENSKGQNPCKVSAYLSAECNQGQWNVPAIGNQGPYNHPTGEFANLCRCNTVVYNLLSDRSNSQGGNVGNWVDWISNCTAGNTTIGRYPLPLPDGTAVPSWAYLDFTQQDSFQVTQAQQYASNNAPPESASVPGQLQTSAGAIAGGVVGGVLGLALLGLIAFILIRKKKQQTNLAPSEKYGDHTQPDSGYPVQQPYSAGHYTPVPADNTGYNPGQGYVQPYAVPNTPGTTYKRPYDPSDPSTFPSTPAPTNNAPTVYSHNQTDYIHQSRPGQYNYTPEL
ncbi:hypothetical protein RhiJN_04498 [Ceratobasidium sp. AG-Ba]|nr:hypothetical protein RhiJN_04498 [Ceratobasidium sp. AG-Ba]